MRLSFTLPRRPNLANIVGILESDVSISPKVQPELSPIYVHHQGTTAGGLEKLGFQSETPNGRSDALSVFSIGGCSVAFVGGLTALP